MNKNVVIIGAGGHAKVVADIVRKNHDTVLGFLDDDKSKHGTPFFGSIILGSTSEYEKYASDACFILAIGNNSVRKKLSQLMKCNWYTAIHPTAVVSEGASIGEGSFIGAGAVVNPDATVGCHTIINTCSVVEHDCRIGDFAHLSPNAAVCGGSCVGTLTWIGAAAVLINGVSVCSEVTIGAGAAVLKSITEKGTYVGVPAKLLKQ